jgi:ABC-type oligopeptide transport system ATPase subunit
VRSGPVWSPDSWDHGSGKSTTMRMIVGLDVPSSGSALIDGKPYNGLAWRLREAGGLLDANRFTRRARRGNTCDDWP